jgi:hypothetical protein
MGEISKYDTILAVRESVNGNIVHKGFLVDVFDGGNNIDGYKTIYMVKSGTNYFKKFYNKPNRQIKIYTTRLVLIEKIISFKKPKTLDF